MNYEHLTPEEEAALRLQYQTQVVMSYKRGIQFLVSCPCCRKIKAPTRELLKQVLTNHLQECRAQRMRKAIGIM